MLKKRPLRLRNQLYLAVTIISITALFTVSQHHYIGHLQAFKDDTAHGITSKAAIVSNTQPKPKNVQAAGRLNRLFNVTNYKPLNDYVKYPCVAGLPSFLGKQQPESGKCVRTINLTDIKTDDRNNCVPLQTFKGSNTIICTHPIDTDLFVSASVQRDGQWERTLVFNIARLLRSEPGTEFLDLGCNIGAYALAMAHQGTKVTAVDPLLPNLELLSKSLIIGNLQNNVTLIWNAISNEHDVVALDSPYGNVGGTIIQQTGSISKSSMNKHLARTITLDDLVPLFRGKRLVIKMDIEGSEYKALLGGRHFFDSVDIILLQLEFEKHKLGEDGQNIADFLESKGLEPYLDLGKRMPLKSSDVSKWSSDVYFLKP